MFRYYYPLKFATKKPLTNVRGFLEMNPWRKAIFPGPYSPSIVAVVSLYGRVRNGNGCYPGTKPPRNLLRFLRYY